jgi:hypothetical protein
MHNALLDALENWRGRQAAEFILEDRGFLIHRAWQQRILDFCGTENAKGLNRYWDEVAREFVTSAGKGDSNSRKFIVEPRYRSLYLDELAAKVNFAEPPVRYPPPVKCMYDYNKKVLSDRDFFLNESSAIELLKEQEFVSHSISIEGWTGLKRDVVPFAKQFSGTQGFVARRNRFAKKCANGLIFEIKVDLGGNPDCGLGLPLQFYIYHENDKGFVFEATLFDRIVPGFSKYAYCQSPKSHILGILAHIDLFDILLHSFESK